MLNRKKIMIIAGVVLLISVVGVATWKSMKPGEKPGKPVQTVAVKESDMEAQVFVNGKIQSKAIRSVNGDAGAKVLTVPVQVGSPVAAGDILCTLDPGDLNYLIEQKTIQIEQEKFKASLAGTNRGTTQRSKLDLAIKAEEKARQERDSRKALFESGALSSSEYQDYVYKYQQASNDLVSAKAEYESNEIGTTSQFQIKLLESELKKLKEDLSKKTLRSPINGIVAEVNAKPQGTVGAEGSLFVVEDTANLEAVTQISEFDISKVHVGQDVILKPSGIKGAELKGKVASVSPTAKLQTTGQTRETVVEVKIDVLEPVKELRSNFSTEIVIKSESRKNALVIPYEALYVSPEGKKEVFVVESGILHIRPVKTGIEGDLEVEVYFKGVKKDLEVVMNPTDALKEGEKVKSMNPEKDGDKK